MKNKSKTWFWTKSANKTDLDIKKKENGNHEIDLKGDESSTEKVVSSEVYKVKIKWSREEKDKLCGEYKKWLKRTQMRH